MRALWVSHLVPYPPKGGVLQRSYHLLHQLSKEFDVDLLAFHQPKLMAPMYDDPDEGLEIAKSELGKFCGSVDVFDLPAGSSNIDMALLALKSLVSRDPYNINWLKSKEFSFRLSQLVKNNNYDLIHFDTVSFFPFLDVVPDGIATSLNHHNIESHMLFRRSSNESNILKKFYFFQESRRLEKYEKIFCERVDINITCSDMDTKRLLELVPDANVDTIPNGVDIDYFVPLEDSALTNNDIKKILFIGRLNWYPNRKAVVYLAEEIWPALKRAIPDVQCDIIGANPPDEIVALSNDDSSFRVHGFVDDILPFMVSSSVYVCPISDGGGTKLKILDALSMGMPIVAHPIACEGINVTEGENVLFAGEAREYVEKIEQLFASKDKMIELGCNARKLIDDQYSYSVIGDRLCYLYLAAVQK